MTPIWSGPFLVATLLLGAASVLKLVRPAQTAGALGAVGLPRSTSIVRAGAAAELVTSAAALVGFRPAAALVALSYIAFAVFVGVALRQRLPIGSCGCFGGVDTPPTRTHLVVNLAAALSATLAALSERSASVASIARSQAGHAVPFMLLVGIVGGLCFVTLTALPQVLALTSARDRR